MKFLFSILMILSATSVSVAGTQAAAGTASSTKYVASALGRSWSGYESQQAQLSLHFYGTTEFSPAAGGDYKGPIAASGELRISSQITGSGCSIPAGLYTVVSVTAAAWENGRFAPIQLQAMGPVTLQVSIMNNSVLEIPAKEAAESAIDWAGRSFPNRLMSHAMITSVSSKCSVELDFGTRP